MSESKLIKDWKDKDVQRLRNIVSKNYTDKTITQIGYTKEQIERKEGDIWEENGKQWTIKNGIKMTITKLDIVKKTLQIPLSCPKCGNAMNKGTIDKKMYNIHKMCSDCVFEYETELKRLGKYEDYQKNINNQGISYHIKEIEDLLFELAFTNNSESFVTEAGDIEEWKGKGYNTQEMVKWLQEYLNKLKSTINS